MSSIFLAKEEQGIVSFKFLKALPYGARMGICFIMLLIGLLIQIFYMEYYIFACILLFVGNLFLLVDGYDNRVKFGAYDPGAKWDKVDKAKFSELIEMQKSMDNWDKSTIDCSNGLGGCIMILMLAACGGLIYLGYTMHVKPLFVLGIDAVILLFPHWVTGLRRVSTVINLGFSKKIKVIEEVVADCQKELAEHEIEYYMLLSGKKDTKIPKDVKFKVDLKGHHPDFLGLYGQVVMNNVQGNLYPYFYTVLVAKKGYPLKSVEGNKVRSSAPKGFFAAFLPTAASVCKERKSQKDVEVLIIRQTTTKQSGYHTDRAAAHNIMQIGIRSAQGNAFK